jgi:hypothetical protein
MYSDRLSGLQRSVHAMKHMRRYRFGKVQIHRDSSLAGIYEQIR